MCRIVDPAVGVVAVDAARADGGRCGGGGGWDGGSTLVDLVGVGGCRVRGGMVGGGSAGRLFRHGDEQGAVELPDL